MTDATFHNEAGHASKPRSLGAIFAGLILIVVLSLGTDIIMHATGVYPPWFQPMSTGLWIFALAYRIVYGIAGGYLTAKLAPTRRMAHALILGFIGTILSIAGAVSTWSAGPELGPTWYPLMLVVIALPCSWLGGKLAIRMAQRHGR